jgi:hypothetical protein
MPLLIMLFALFVPRVVIAVLFLFTTWFSGVFNGILLPIIGFIGFPYALLTYSLLVNLGSGVSNIWGLLIMILAIVADLGSWWSGYGYSSGHWHWHSDEAL